MEHLRKTVGVVSQEPILFDGTLESNIRMGNDDVTMQQIVDATKQANAYRYRTNDSSTFFSADQCCWTRQVACTKQDRATAKSVP